MVSVIIVAAGSSSRMNGVNKQLEKIGDIPVFVMSALKFDKSDKVGEILIAAPEDDVQRYEKLARNFGVEKLAAVVAGGDTRMGSVRRCLDKVSTKADYIAVHDGARPLIEPEDSPVLELCGEYVKITEIESCNMKITRPEDLAAAEAIYLSKRTVKNV